MRKKESVVRGVRIDPRLWEELQRVAEARGQSRNEMIAEILQNCCTNFKKGIDKGEEV